ncbi:MAG: sulfite oxidase [Anaerolineae bacterium]
MSLYFVRHQHSAETCPAKDPQMGQMLLQHVSKTNARKFGVDLLGEAVLDNQHTLIDSASNETNVPNFLREHSMQKRIELYCR